MNTDINRPEIQPGSLAEITINNDFVGTFKVTYIRYQPDNIMIYLIPSNVNYQKQPIILNISQERNDILGLSSRFDPVGDELSITFLIPIEFEDLMDGLVVADDGKLQLVKNRLKYFLDGNEEVLDLGFLEIEELPREYFTHPKIINSLQNLKLNSNKLTSLPEEIGNLQNLRSLDLYANQLTSLPGEIGNLQNLQHLYLGLNRLTSLPFEIGKLLNLKSLGLYANPLEEGTPKTFQEFIQQWRRYQESSRNIKSAYKN